MIDQAQQAGVPIDLLDLNPAQRTITNPLVHDERSGLGRLLGEDRIVEFPNDPNWAPLPQDPDAEEDIGNDIFQRSNPDYQTITQFIRSDGTVDIDAYQQWLQQNRGFTLQR